MGIAGALFETGLVALIAMAVLMGEAVWLRLCRPNLPAGMIVWNAMAGLGLLSALYFALTGGNPIAIGAFLLLALIGQLGDLNVRLAAHKG